MKLSAPCLALACAAFSLVPLQARAAGSAPLAQYQRTVHRERLTVDRLFSAGRLTPADVHRLQATLARVTKVRLPDGRLLALQPPHIGEQLSSGDASSVGRAVAQLNALDDALHMLPARDANPNELHKLDDVLRAPRFVQHRSLTDVLKDWLGSLIERLFSGIPSPSGLSPLLAVLFGALFLALVAGVGFLAVRGALSTIVVEAAIAKEDEGSQELSASDRASERAAAGDYRTALRYLFLGTMLQLQDRGVVELRPGLTNREYLALVQQTAANRASVVSPLQELTDAFDRAWYGHVPVDESEYHRCEQLTQQVSAALSKERAA